MIKKLLLFFAALAVAVPNALALSVPERPEVRRFVRHYLVSERIWLKRAIRRYYLFKGTVESILASEGCPKELSVLAIVESGYDGRAVSRRRAVGFWQFIRSTARLYGLRMGRYLDERRDIVKSTRAAARYLRKLYGKFGDWELAIAAYNGGEGYIGRLLKKTGATSFWELSPYLRRETREFVPRFYAVLKIVRENLLPVKKPKPLRLKRIVLPGNIHLRDVARYSGLDYSLLSLLNPHLLRGKTPPYGGRIYVPAEKAPKVLASLSVMLARKKAKSLGIRFYAGYWRGYVVKKGDSLWRLARRFRVPVSLLKTVNLMETNIIRPGEILLIPTKRLIERIAYVDPKRKAIIYTVKRGDSLWKVSKLFGVDIRSIRKLNGIGRRHRLKPGQKLTIVLGESVERRT